MRFGILGPFEVADDQGRELALGGPKQRAVLAILLLHAGEVVLSDRLIEELWGERAPATGAKTLRVYVSNLRKALGAGVLVTRGGGYVLDVADAEVDADRFQMAAAEGGRALRAGNPHAAAERLREALRLWRGPPLAEFTYEPFAQGEIARLEELRLAAVADRVDADLAIGDRGGLVGELEALVREHPLQERLRGQLMLALYRAGRPADALAVYRELSAMLRDELGLEPSASLRELERSILQQDPTLAAPRATSPQPGNLPVPATPFLGREREVGDITAPLRTEARLLTLTGAGGSGKTRLALTVAETLAAQYRDGAWFVGFADVTDPELIIPTILHALELAEQPDLAPERRLRTWLRERELLLVLDNLEQLTMGTAVLGELLSASSHLTMIVTSREPLHLAGEHQYEVPGLDPTDAIELFTSRARAVAPRVRVDGELANAICERLDRLPLAIELAAARTKALAPTDILAHLDTALPLLTGGPRDAPHRQRTLTATIDWSYKLLTDDQQQLFRGLSVFAGGFTLDLAEDVCGDHVLWRVSVLDLLASLVDKSLVVAEERGTAVRYRLLETVRQYARERLIEAREERAMRDRHRDAMLELAERIASQIPGPSEREWLTTLDYEAANLAAALERAHESDGETALRLCVALTVWWKYRGLFESGERGFTRALEAADPAPSSLRARALRERGVLAGYAGAFEAAIGSLRAAAETAEEAGDQLTLARSVGSLGWMQTYRDPVSSLSSHERAYELASFSGDLSEMTRARIAHAVACTICGELDEAERFLSEAVSLSQQMGSRDALRWCWLIKSMRPLWAGDADRFREFAEQARALSSEFGDPGCEGQADTLIGMDETWRGHAEAAIERLEASRERMIAAGAGFAMKYTETSLAYARLTVGDTETARASLDAVVASGADRGWVLTWATLTLAHLLRICGDPPTAEARATDALRIADRMQSPVMIAQTKEVLGRLAAARGELGPAQELVHESLGAHVTHEFWTFVPQTLDALAEIVTRLGSDEEAARILGIAQRARDELGLVRWAPDRPRMAQVERTLRDELGHEAFRVATYEGAALSREEAITWLRHARAEPTAPRPRVGRPNARRPTRRAPGDPGAHQADDRSTDVHLPQDRRGPPVSQPRQTQPHNRPALATEAPRTDPEP